jgi:hypothetical protein
MNRARILNQGRLGDLPRELAAERNESDPLPPMGLPPMGGSQGRTGSGQSLPTVFDQSSWGYLTFIADIEPKKIQDFTLRKFFLIQNKALVGSMFVGVGYIPTADNGLLLLPQTGYEPFRYPTNEIYVSASQDGVLGLLIYGV